jgi:hypothetical protein
MAYVADDEADAGVKLARMPLDLGNHPALRMLRAQPHGKCGAHDGAPGPPRKVFAIARKNTTSLTLPPKGTRS